MSIDQRPHGSRQRHQAALQRRERRLRKRRKARVRRIHLFRTLSSVRFWMRASAVLALLACLTFWAKFAFVYDIPTFAERGMIAGVRAYITVKPWWFGPPTFDLASYMTLGGGELQSTDPYHVLLDRLGHYQDVVQHPVFIWTEPL